MSKLTDDLRACDPITSPNVAGILMDTAATRIEALERELSEVQCSTIHPFQIEIGPLLPLAAASDEPCNLRIARLSDEERT